MCHTAYHNGMIVPNIRSGIGGRESSRLPIQSDNSIDYLSSRFTIDDTNSMGKKNAGKERETNQMSSYANQFQ